MTLCHDSFPDDILTDLDGFNIRENNNSVVFRQQPKQDEEATCEKIAKIDECHDEEYDKGANHEQKKVISSQGGELGHQENTRFGAKNVGGAGSENGDDGSGERGSLAGKKEPESGVPAEDILSYARIFQNGINPDLSEDRSDEARVEKLENTRKNKESLVVKICLTPEKTRILQVLDLMTVLLPGKILPEDVQRINRILKEDNSKLDFIPGQLSDTIIDCFFWILQKCDHKILAAEYFVSFLLIGGNQNVYPRWNQQDIKNAKWILFPINRSCHWTLLAFDLQFKKKIYLDPYKGVGYTLDAKNSPELMKLINAISKCVDSYSKLGTETWQCVQPQHAQQKDDHSCGVFICLFARLLTINGDLKIERDMEKERKALLVTMLRACDFQ